MLELLYHKRNNLIMTVVDGSICTSTRMFGREILKFSKITRLIYPKNPQTKMWLLFNHTKHFVLKLISFKSRQLATSERAITK